MATPIWKDTYYTVENEESVDYFIMDDSTGRVIHRGRSYPDGTGKIRIPVNRICAFYVNNDLEESFFESLSFRNTTGKFSFYVNDRFITTYDFNPDWSYDTDHEAKGEISFPINGHYIPGHNVWASRYN